MTTGDAGGAPSSLVERLLAGDRGALGRAITAVENETPFSRTILRQVEARVGRARVIGFTGPPGAGKSSLINASIHELRRRNRTVGVVAVDPSSPISGGAILGDRIRLVEHSADDGVFFRSVASRGHLGGLSRTTARVVDLLDAAGTEVILVETVGAGQSEVEVMDVVQTKLVVCAPGLGDDVQALKAGILEIADLLVVNKADLPLADRAARQLRSMLALRTFGTAWRPRIVKTVATTGQGVAELFDEVDAHGEFLGDEVRRRNPRRHIRQLIAAIASERVHREVARLDGEWFDELCDRVRRGDCDLEDAASEALAAAVGTSSDPVGRVPAAPARRVEQ